MLPALIVAGFVLRAAVGLYRGGGFFSQGYAFYVDIAASVLRGDGFCYAAGEGCAVRMPLYPAVIVPFLATGSVFPGLVILQSALGALQIWLAWRLGRALFNARTGLVAAALTALNPYALVHDTAFQDTAVFNTLVLLAGVLLLEATAARSRRVASAASAALGLAMLTSGRIALLLPCVIAWAACAGVGDRRARMARAAAIAGVLVLVAGGWTLRNWQVTGAPVLSTETGMSLWIANHPGTLQSYPRQSIDMTTRHAWDLLSPQQQRTLNSATDVDRDRIFGDLAFAYAREHPVGALGAAAWKVAAAFSGQLSPAREGVSQWAFAVIFVPVHVLAAAGLWRARPWSGGHALSVLVFVSFAATTAIFWAHTSHASYLHPWLFVYAASAAKSGLATLTPSGGPAVSASRCSGS